MKQRSKDLVQQAREYAHATFPQPETPAGPPPVTIPAKTLEWIQAYESKLVELVVMECIDVGTTAWWASESKVFPVDQIKSHFFEGN